MIIGFNKLIYKKKAIKSAIGDFNHLADFKIKETKKYHQVEIKNIDKDVDKVIKDEFCNFVLSLMN